LGLLQRILRRGYFPSGFNVFRLKQFVFLFVARDFAIFLFDQGESIAMGCFEGLNAGFLTGDGFFQRRVCGLESRNL
jgi:hypothetical protein